MMSQRPFLQKAYTCIIFKSEESENLRKTLHFYAEKFLSKTNKQTRAIMHNSETSYNGRTLISRTS